MFDTSRILWAIIISTGLLFLILVYIATKLESLIKTITKRHHDEDIKTAVQAELSKTKQ